MTDIRLDQIPEGFLPIPTRGPFTDINGPIWQGPSRDGLLPRFGFFPEKRHTNALGFVHGGMVSTLLDSSMAHAVFDRYACRLVTLTLQIQFKNAVFPGRWAEIEVTLDQQGETEIRARATLFSRGAVSVEGNAVYRLFPRKD